LEEVSIDKNFHGLHILFAWSV